VKSPDNIVMVHGVPRSGTSWLGQILNSSPEVAFRFQPLFSYAFKDRIGPSSTAEEISLFLDELYASDDDFIHQRDQVERGAYPLFAKSPEPTHMVLKQVRYHHVLENMIIRLMDRVKVVGIARHPCAVLNSWIRAPREFHPEWDIHAEWREAPSKNLGRPEEFYGFDKWRETTELFQRLSLDYPDNFILVRYSALNSDTEREVGRIFSFCGLDLGEQTTTFLEESRSRTHPHVNAVYRNRNDNEKWRRELDPAIAEAVIAEVTGTRLETFLEG